VAASPAAGVEQIPNPAYERWYDQDQQLLSGILSSMIEDVLQDVVAAKSSREVWDSLQKKFASSTKACTVQICVELTTAKKHDLSAVDFFHKITGLAAELAAADAPLRDEEVLSYLLASLPAEYDPFVTSMTTKAEALSLDDVFAHLVAFEARKLQHLADLQLNHGASVNYVGRRRGGRGGQSRGGAPSHGERRGNNPRPECQICGRVSHTAVKCWYRMDESFQDEHPSAALASTSSYKVDPNWYSDTGATDHITSDLDRLTVRDQYQGNGMVQVGNGAGLKIMHVGSYSINTDTRPLALNNVLHVPEISKHLLSVHKLSRDNNVFFEFHPWYFLIKD
jgi:hypothetical protein